MSSWQITEVQKRIKTQLFHQGIEIFLSLYAYDYAYVVRENIPSVLFFQGLWLWLIITSFITDTLFL